MSYFTLRIYEPIQCHEPTPKKRKDEPLNFVSSLAIGRIGILNVESKWGGIGRIFATYDFSEDHHAGKVPDVGTTLRPPHTTCQTGRGRR